MKSKRDYGTYDPASAKAAASRGATSGRSGPVTSRTPTPRKTSAKSARPRKP
jgi:hypothetical protein